MNHEKCIRWGFVMCNSTCSWLKQVATKYPTNALVHRPVLISYILSTKVDPLPPFHSWLLWVDFAGADKMFFLLHHSLPWWSKHEHSPFQIKNPAQLDAALAFLTNTGPDSLDVGKFEEACGVGMFPLNGLYQYASLYSMPCIVLRIFWYVAWLICSFGTRKSIC